MYYGITEGSELNNFCVIWGQSLILLSCLFLPLRQSEMLKKTPNNPTKEASFLLVVIRLSEYCFNTSCQ